MGEGVDDVDGDVVVGVTSEEKMWRMKSHASPGGRRMRTTD